MPNKLIPGWYTQKDGILKIFECPGCKMSLATSGDEVECKNCKRTYTLDQSNREKVVMEGEG